VSARRVGVAAAIAILALPSPAHAQLHWDASAQVGVVKRFLSDRPFSNAPDAGFGPSGQLAVHVALLPLVHAGAYASHDVTWLAAAGGVDGPARHITTGGLRAKGMIPFVRGDTRAWIFAGFGYARAYQESADRDDQALISSTVPRVQGAGGGFFEVPFGIGASYKIRKPWELFFELGARVGFAHRGDAYDEGPRVIAVGVGPSPHEPARYPPRCPPAGIDRFAIGLTAGVMLDL
jgi:hypothetical protein